MEKNLIVYYSLTGNTHVVAETIQSLTGYDTVRIEEKKTRKKSAIAAAATGAFLRLKSRLKTMDYMMSNYETLLLGSPVWVGKTPPAINQFLDKARFRDKIVYLFLTGAEEKIPQKAIDSIVRRVEKNGGSVADTIVIKTAFDPKIPKTIEKEDVLEQIKEWLAKIDH